MEFYEFSEVQKKELAAIEGHLERGYCSFAAKEKDALRKKAIRTSTALRGEYGIDVDRSQRYF